MLTIEILILRKLCGLRFGGSKGCDQEHAAGAREFDQLIIGSFVGGP